MCRLTLLVSVDTAILPGPPHGVIMRGLQFRVQRDTTRVSFLHFSVPSPAFAPLAALCMNTHTPCTYSLLIMGYTVVYVCVFKHAFLWRALNVMWYVNVHAHVTPAQLMRHGIVHEERLGNIFREL